MSTILDGLLNGISFAAILLIATLGLAMVYRLMGVINIAHGEFIILGAYTTSVVQNHLDKLGSIPENIYIIIAIPIAFIFTAILGWILEQGIIKKLQGRPLEILLATWGVSLIIQQLLKTINLTFVLGSFLFLVLLFGPYWFLSQRPNFHLIKNQVITFFFIISLTITSLFSYGLAGTFKLFVTQPWFGSENLKILTPPAWLQGAVAIANVQIPYIPIFIITTTIICLILIYLLLYQTRLGLRIRAVTENRTMSACLGISPQNIDTLTFAIGSGLAGIAGSLLSLIDSVSPSSGQYYLIDTFMVLLISGFGNITRIIIAALIIGIANHIIGSSILVTLIGSNTPNLATFFQFFATTSMAKVIIFALIILFLQFRSIGIFSPKRDSLEL